MAAWSGDAGLKQYEVMKSALGARTQPMILSISTAGYINDSIYDELMKRSTSFLKGNSKERRLLPFLYMIDDVEKWNDIDELKKANPNMGVSVKESFFMDEIAVAEGSLSKKAEFLTKYCNIKQNSSIAWLEYQTVENAGVEKTLEDFRDCYAVGGIDLSQTTDLTAASVVIQKDGTLYAFTQFFMPRGRLEYLQATDGVPYDIFVKKGLITLSGENYVDYHDVYDWFTMLLEDYGIRPLKIGYDRYSAQYLITDMANYGFHMDDVYQGENLTPVIREFEGIIKDGNFKIVNNNLLKSHFLNVALKQNMETRKFRPIKIEQRAHIDGFVSVIDAYDSTAEILCRSRRDAKERRLERRVNGIKFLDYLFHGKQLRVIDSYFKMLNGYSPTFTSYNGGVYEMEFNTDSYKQFRNALQQINAGDHRQRAQKS